jgi:hypothetical protein
LQAFAAVGDGGAVVARSATSINGIAILDIFGWRGVATASTLLALTAAAWLRALIVQADTLRLAAEFEGVRGGIRDSGPG